MPRRGFTGRWLGAGRGATVAARILLSGRWRVRTCGSSGGGGLEAGTTPSNEESDESDEIAMSHRGDVYTRTFAVRMRRWEDAPLALVSIVAHGYCVDICALWQFLWTMLTLVFRTKLNTS